MQSSGLNQSRSKDQRSQSRGHEISQADAGLAYRSGFGAEFPAAVYQSILFAFAWMLVAAWLAFGGLVDTDLDLGVVTILSAVFLLLPIIMYRTSAAHSRIERLDLKRFLSSRFETATGAIPAKEAWLQVALIPIALAVAAVLIGGVYVFTG